MKEALLIMVKSLCDQGKLIGERVWEKTTAAVKKDETKESRLLGPR